MHFCPRTRHTRTPRKLKKRLVKKGLLWQVDRLAKNSLNEMRRRHEVILRLFLLGPAPTFMREFKADFVSGTRADLIVLDDIPLAE